MKNEGITSQNGYAISKLSYIAGDSSLGYSISFLSRVRLNECFPHKTLIGRKMIQNVKMVGVKLKWISLMAGLKKKVYGEGFKKNLATKLFLFQR